MIQQVWKESRGFAERRNEGTVKNREKLPHAALQIR